MLHVPLDLHWNQRTKLQRNQKREKGNKHNNKHNDNQNDCFGTKMHHNRNRDWLNDSRQSPSRKRPLPASANQSWKKPCSSAFSRLSVAPGRWCVSFSSDLVQMIFYAWYTTQRKKTHVQFSSFSSSAWCVLPQPVIQTRQIHNDQLLVRVVHINILF